MFDTVLVANRGEIALRVMRACHELGLCAVAVYSEADRDAPHVAYADAAYTIGPGPAAESYLNIERLIAVAQQAGVGAIHPGYGFLSENAAFAHAVANAGLVFIGPPAAAMERMGGKVAARREATTANVPVVPGVLEAVADAAEVRRLGEQFGYPIAIKAVAGGGGRGLRVVRAPAEVDDAFASARREAEAAFKNGELYVEKYLDDPRHIEIQVLADTQGNVIHLGERECSIQRRHQKLIEECPSPVISPALRAEMGAAAVRLAYEVGYVGAGTLEFLYQDGHYYFLEMNTRIQVEHAITEMVYGLDLIKAQLRIAQGLPLDVYQEDLLPHGHAIECRINAEDPSAGFRPALGTIGAYTEPSGFGVRVDSGVRAGWIIPQFYDSLLSKLIVWGQDRTEAIARMQRALADYQIEGVITTIPFHRATFAQPAFVAGDTTVNFIPQHPQVLVGAEPADGRPATEPGMEPAPPRQFDVEVNGRRFSVRVAEVGGQEAQTENRTPRTENRTPRNGRRGTGSQSSVLGSSAIISPIQGTVVAVRAEPGQQVEAGTVLFVVEAMKMENEITAPRAGVLAEVRAVAGTTVESGAILATYQE